MRWAMARARATPPFAGSGTNRTRGSRSAATRAIRADLPGTAVLVLTMFDEDDLVASALAAGARGYLLKGAESAEIDRAVRAVAGGEHSPAAGADAIATLIGL